MKKFSTFKERIRQFLQLQSVGINEFYDKTGISDGTLSNSSGMSEDNLLKLFSSYPDLNFEWLLTGKGGMIKKPKQSDVLNDEIHAYQLDNPKGVPLVETAAAAGFGTAKFNIQEQDVLARYQVPSFEKMDFMLPIRGDSMQPKYQSGDIVGCRIVQQVLEWNRAYIIATKDQGILCKKLKPSNKEGHYLAVSENQDYDPFEIPKDEITGLALVVGVIRVE